MSDNVDLSQLHLFLDIAGRPSTMDGEAVAAIRQVHRVLNKAGLTVANLRISGVAHAVIDTRAPMSHKGAKLKMDELEIEIEELKKENKSLTKSNSRLTAENERLITTGKSADGSMRWQVFVTKGVSRNNGQYQGFRAAFARHIGIRVTEMDKWEQAGKVPPEAVQGLNTFHGQTKVRVEWTFDREDRLMDLSKDRSDHEMALDLTKEWGFEVSFGGVKKARQRARARVRTLEIYDSGVIDVPEIFKILHGEFGDGFGGVSLNAIGQVLSHFRSEVAA